MTLIAPQWLVALFAYVAIAFALLMTFEVFRWIGMRTIEADRDRVWLVFVALFGWAAIEILLALARPLVAACR